jgi:hypothetical protein
VNKKEEAYFSHKAPEGMKPFELKFQIYKEFGELTRKVEWVGGVNNLFFIFLIIPFYFSGLFYL